MRTKALLLPALLALGCSAASPHPFFAQRQPPYLFAHRGGGGHAPEATLPTLLAAEAQDPLAIVEFDLHRSRDGHLVVIHDDTVDRTTDGAGRVEDLTLAELKALDAGYCAVPGEGDGTAPPEVCRTAPASTFPFRGLGYQVPTLAEVLGALRPDTPVAIEVKAAGFEEPFAAAIRASGRLDRVVVGSALDEVAIRLKDLLPEAPHYLPTGAATCFALTTTLRLDFAGCPRYEVFASPLSSSGLTLDTSHVMAAARRKGMRTVFWTVNDEAEMERLFRLGADGIFTDYPQTARTVIDRLTAQGALP